MTTDTWSSASQATNDAQWQALVTAISDSLDTVGWDLTADTGQINPATTTIPSSGSYAGYEVRFFNDALHATKPVVTKLEYGRGSSNAANALVIRVTVGSGTNGAGTITGTTYVAVIAITNQNNTGAGGTYPWYFAGEDGYVAIAAARGMAAGQWFFSLSRTAGDDGEHNDEGVLMMHSSTSRMLARRRHITSEVADGARVAMLAGLETTTAVGADRQVMRHFAMQPATRCVPHYLSYIETEIGNESTFSFTPVGARSRTFLALGGATDLCPNTCSLNAVANHALAMQFD